MNETIGILNQSLLFRDIEIEELKKLFQVIHFQIRKYQKNEIIAFSGDECSSLKLVLKGSVKGEMMDMAGRSLKIEDILPPRPLAVAFLFGENNRYPVTVTTNEPASIMVLPRDSVIRMMQLNATFLINFMNAVSNRAQFISSKLKFLSFQSLRGKLAHYLLELDREESGIVIIPKTHEELADLFGVARPSLSRTLRELHNDGLIIAQRKSIQIVNRNGLKGYLGN